MTDAYDPGLDDTGLELEEDFDAQGDEDLDERFEAGGLEDEDQQDHGEENPSGEDEGQGRQPHQVGQGRADRRIRSLSEENRRLREQLQRGQGQGQGGAPSQEQLRLAEQQERDRLALMSPEERFDYRLTQQEERHRRDLAQVRFETADAADKTAFDQLCARNPQAARLKDRVEQALAAERAKGFTYPRETVLKFVIGESVLKSAPRAQNRQQREASEQRQRQQARPGQGRSDVNQGGGRQTDERAARADRLKDVQI